MSKFTIVTGASRGIGRYITETLLDQGFIVAGCSRGPSELDKENYFHYQLEISDENQVKEFFKVVKKRFGKLDNLINNAGIASMNHSILTPGRVLTSILNTNVIGSFLFARESAKLMKVVGCGRIINFSTVAVPLNLEGEAIYSASKAAVEQLTRVWAKEFASFGITVNAIGPVPIKTGLIRNVPENKLKSILDSQAIKRYGNFEDVMNVINFFLLPSSNFITGQTLYLGGII